MNKPHSVDRDSHLYACLENFKHYFPNNYQQILTCIDWHTLAQEELKRRIEKIIHEMHTDDLATIALGHTHIDDILSDLEQNGEES